MLAGSADRPHTPLNGLTSKDIPLFLTFSRRGRRDPNFAELSRTLGTPHVIVVSATAETRDSLAEPQVRRPSFRPAHATPKQPRAPRVPSASVSVGLPWRLPWVAVVQWWRSAAEGQR